MHQNMSPQKDTPAPTLKIENLPLDAMLFVETEKYVYKLEVVTADSVIQVETGDSYIGDGLFYGMVEITQGEPLVFIHPAGNKRTAKVEHVEVSGTNENGPWSYEVF